jgi:hypothetical protein
MIQPFAGGLESTAPQLEPSSTPISDKAFNMIVMFEVSSQAAYQAKYQHPIWPGGASGVTIGIGYDVGYVSQQLLGQDWQGAIPDAVIQALRPAIGVRGASAQGLAQSLQATVTVPWTPAITVHRTKVIPKWIALVQKYLSNTDKLDGDCLGALVSNLQSRCLVRPGRRPFHGNAEHQGRHGVAEFRRHTRPDTEHEASVADRQGIADPARQRGRAIRSGICRVDTKHIAIQATGGVFNIHP